MDDEQVKGLISKCVRCADWESTVRASDAVILPLPVSSDGIRLSCPFAGVDYDIRLTAVVEKCSHGTLLLGGMIPPLAARMAEERGLVVYDYYEREALQIKNAIPTAEGALAIAINELPVTVQNCTVLITGYGRVARSLAIRLHLLGAKVFAAARSGRDLALAESDGCIPIKLDAYKKEPIGTDIIFNTVPTMIFDRELQNKLKKSTLIVELASGNSGVEMKVNSGIRIISAQGLPGKLSPFTAGEIIFDAIKDILEEENGK
jgi:dipicolinate synthase subunit A